MGKRLKYLLTIGLLFCQVALADSVTKPHTWVDGETPTAALWNANEDAIIAGVNSVSSSQIVDGTLVNADISGSAAIAYSKLTLTDSVVSGDIAAGTIVNSDINASAAIVDTKLATISTASKVNTSALVTTSQAQGDILYASDATTWTRLGAGTSGQYLKTQGAAANPTWASVDSSITGEVRLWTTSSPPTGWLMCDGSAVSRTTYSALFAVISTTFGVGDGSTTFNLPNTDDRMVIGNGATVGGIGTVGGDLTGSGTTIRTATAADSDQQSPDGSDGSQESEATHSHKYPKYIGLEYIIKT